MYNMYIYITFYSGRSAIPQPPAGPGLDETF